MKKLRLTILSTILVSASLYVTDLYAQENTYETYKKPIKKSYNGEEVPKEVKDDIDSLKGIEYLKLKTSSNYEIAMSNDDGTYSYIKSSENLEEAIDLADNLQSQKFNGIPAVINSDGIVVYATQGIGRVIKMVGGIPSTDTSTTAYIYKTSQLKSPEHTYINHSYIDDVPVLENNGTSSKIEVTGYTGFIKNTNDDGSSNLVIVPINKAKSLSYYNVNDNGDLVHNISSDITKENASYSRQLRGPAPSFLKRNVKYYSYDGMYFYESIETLLDDAKKNHHNNAINVASPYYNYYQYLPSRSKTSYTAIEIDRYFEQYTPADSVLRGSGKYFVEAQNKYGTNASTLIGIAMNESSRGTSKLAKEKLNVFGAGARDYYPEGADKFDSVEQCILEVANDYFSNGYFNPKSWKYNSSSLGNKEFGINVRYASDPFWSEKAVNRMYELDKYLGSNTGLKDYNRYLLGVYTNKTTVKTTLNKDLYNILGSGERNNLYGNNPSLGQVGDSTIILDTDANNYEIRPDRIVGINEVNHNKDGTYLWDIYGVVSKNDIKIINEKSNVQTDFSSTWGKEYIVDAMNKGWVETTNTFNPHNNITRAEFVKIVNRAFNLTKKGNMPFTDVSKNMWYYDDISIAYEAGYISGKGNNIFAPEDAITRQEVSKIVGKLLGIKNDSDIDTGFNDDIYIQNWADGYIKGLVDMGILSGYDDNTFRPDNNITREESVKILSMGRR